MSTTINNTLPQEWKNNITYNSNDQVFFAGIIYSSLIDNNINNIPKDNPTIWKSIDIYRKVETLMSYGEYSGDENFWERDNVRFENGYLFLNNENTGIKVSEKADITVAFDELTPQQKESLKGDAGERGPQGETGPAGPQGPMGEVILTEEQIEQLRGPAGLSTYDIWSKTHTGSESAFLDWVRQSLQSYDDKLLSTSTNAVKNSAIYNAFYAYQTVVNEALNVCMQRIEALENRLKSTYNNEEHNFIFGITDTGEYGYRKTYDTQIIPFDATTTNQNAVQSNQILTSPYANFAIGAQQYITTESMVTAQNSTELAASLSDIVSSSNDDTTETINSNSIEIEDFEDFADIVVYIYKKETQSFYKVGYSLYNTENSFEGIVSNNEENIEGILLVAETASLGHTIYFDVKPYNEGDTIEYQIGLGLNTSGTVSTLPSVANGTNRYSYTTGSFNDSTTISFDLSAGYRPYFSSINGGKYLIENIYLK